MIKYVIIGLLFLSGCYSSVKYNPNTGEMKYTRIGDQKFNGLKVNIDPNTGAIKVEIESQESKGDLGSNIAIIAEKMFELGLKAGQ